MSKFNADHINSQPRWKLWTAIVLMPLFAIAFVDRFLGMIAAGNVLPRDGGMFFPLFIGAWGLFMACVATWILFRTVVRFKHDPKGNTLAKAASVIVALSFLAIGSCAVVGALAQFDMMG